MADLVGRDSQFKALRVLDRTAPSAKPPMAMPSLTSCWARSSRGPAAPVAAPRASRACATSG
jgi:hypothetical protein